MKLRNTLKAAPLALGALWSTHVSAGEQEPQQDWNITGFTRVLVETGDRATNLNYPEIMINGQKGNWAFQIAPDFVDATPQTIGGKTTLRAHTATIAYTHGNTSIKAGMLPPFGRRLTSAEFDSGMMGAYLSDQFVTRGGIFGVEISQKQALDSGTTATWHVMGGTKIESISKFGNPNGPGFDAPVYGGGVDVQRGNLKAAYNYTHFGEGPGGASQDVHYASAAFSHKIQNVTVQLLGEYQSTATHAARVTHGDHYTLMAQAKGPLKGQFGWRAAAGVADGNPALETFLTYKPGKWAVQLGVAAVFEDTRPDFIGNLVLKHNF